MRIEDLIQDFDNAINEIQDSMPNIVISTASSGLALIRNRVIGTGKTARSSKNTYTDGYYKSLRQSKGRQTNHKDYRFTSSMWNNINAIPSTSRENGNVFSVDVDALDAKERNKLRCNNERDGVDILENTQEEIDKLQQSVAFDIQRILTKNFT